MLFNSSFYIFLFLPCAAAGYFLLNRWKLVSAATAWLVLASLFFYGCWKTSYVLILAGSIAVNFALGSMLHQTEKTAFSVARSLILPIGILFNLSLLGYCKYADFFLENVNWLLGTAWPLPHLALPPAISFFIFQQIAYLVDCRRRESNDTFLNYCLFVSFFPQLLSGPISRRHELMPQLVRLRNRLFSPRNAALGLFFFSLGLFKKVWLADQFAVWANAGFASPSPLSFFDAWGTSLSYTFQLYFDFSGYTDMAIGSALFFNILLPVNFDSPYQSASIQEFWRRWHVTLSRWLRDYLYIPLGGSRKGQLRTCLNLLITFLLAGLWHGAGWTFVVWGALHGAALVLHRFWKDLGLRMPALLGWLTTFLFVNASWVIFRAANLREGLRVLQGMAGSNGIAFSSAFTKLLGSISGAQHYAERFKSAAVILPAQMYWHLLLFGIILFLLPNSCRISGLISQKEQQPHGKMEAAFRKAGSVLFSFRPSCYWALLTATLFSMALYRLFQAVPSAFLYFNF